MIFTRKLQIWMENMKFWGHCLLKDLTFHSLKYITMLSSWILRKRIHNSYDSSLGTLRMVGYCEKSEVMLGIIKSETSHLGGRSFKGMCLILTHITYFQPAFKCLLVIYWRFFLKNYEWNSPVVLSVYFPHSLMWWS